MKESIPEQGHGPVPEGKSTTATVPISPWVALKSLWRGTIHTQELLPPPWPSSSLPRHCSRRQSGGLGTSLTAVRTAGDSPTAAGPGTALGLGHSGWGARGGHKSVPTAPDSGAVTGGVGTGISPGADPVPGRRGVVRVDVELRDVAIDQCSSGPGWFSDTHRCDLNSTQVPAPGTPHPRQERVPLTQAPPTPGRAARAPRPSLRAELYPLSRPIHLPWLSCSRPAPRAVYCANLPSPPPPAAPCDPAAPCPGTAGTLSPRWWHRRGSSSSAARAFRGLAQPEPPGGLNPAAPPSSGDTSRAVPKRERRRQLLFPRRDAFPEGRAVLRASLQKTTMPGGAASAARSGRDAAGGD